MNYQSLLRGLESRYGRPFMVSFSPGHISFSTFTAHGYRVDLEYPYQPEILPEFIRMVAEDFDRELLHQPPDPKPKYPGVRHRPGRKRPPRLITCPVARKPPAPIGFSG